VRKIDLKITSEIPPNPPEGVKKLGGRGNESWTTEEAFSSPISVFSQLLFAKGEAGRDF
jgi:hypothetical protein